MKFLAQVFAAMPVKSSLL